jgi:hypothetical protein
MFILQRPTLFDVVLCTTVGFGGWGCGKIIPTISTVLILKPTVKIPRLQCIQFVGFLFFTILIEQWLCSTLVWQNISQFCALSKFK